MVEIRKEEQKDWDAVRAVNDLAFAEQTEGLIVDKIREACKETVPLVAVLEGQIVGHIFFSPAISTWTIHTLKVWDSHPWLYYRIFRIEV